MSSKKVFVIHGWTYSLDKWDQAFAEMEKLGLKPVMLKVPGLSEPSDDVWDVESYVDWLRQKIEGEKDPLIVGHSNGGRIAMAYDVASPGHIRRLVLVASAGVYNDGSQISLKRKVFKAIAKVVKPFARGPVRKALYRVIGANDYGNAAPNMRQTMINVTEHDKTFELNKVTAQATLIWGDHDTSTPIQDAEVIHGALPHADELHVIHGSGHSPHAADPKRVANLILAASKE